MKALLRSVSFLALAFSALAPLSSTAHAADKAAKIPATLRDIPVPADAYEPPYPGDYRVTLSDNAVAFLIPDSTLDLVRFYVYVPRPSLPAKPADVARMELYSALLKDGGTRALSPEKLEDSLEFVAADLSAGIGAWQAEASFDALSKDADAMLSLLGDVILKPGLDPAAFQVARREMLEGFKHRYATPGAVMGALYERVMQGSHPANWEPSEAELAGVTPAALKPLSGTGFIRDGMVIGVAGRFDRADMIRKLEAFVARFPAGAPESDPQTFHGPRAPGVYLVDKPFAQASIRIAAPGVKRPDPDYYRLLVASEIFGGGGFTSRLALRVRSNEGLAYTVGSDVESDYNRCGSVRVGLQTKAATGAYATRLVLDEMRRMATDSAAAITDVEMERARETMLKSLPSLFDSPAATARVFAQSEAWGRSPEHFRDYRKTLETLTRAEVQDAFRRYFVADSMRILVVGPKETLLKPDARGLSLKDFGTVTDVTEEELDRRIK